MPRPSFPILPFALLLLLVAAPATAEDAAAGNTVAAVAVAAPPAPPPPPRASLSEQAREAAVKLRAVEAQTFRVHAELRGARRGRDAERVACLDGLLTRLHVATRDGRARQEAIEGARKAGDAEAEAREVTRLVYLADRAERLHRSAGLCRSRSVLVVQGPNGTQVRSSSPVLPEAAGYPASADRPDASPRR